jgi:hypothetical protein
MAEIKRLAVLNKSIIECRVTPLILKYKMYKYKTDDKTK